VRQLAAAALALGLAACTVSPVDFSEKRCPCDVGYTCDEARDVCVEGTIRDDGGMPVDGLVLHYPLDVRPGGTDDVSGNGHHASCEPGACPVAIEGRIGGAASFDGIRQHLVAADDGSLVTATAFTVSIWARPDRLTRATAFGKRRDSEDVDAIVWALQMDAAGRASFVVGSDRQGEVRVSSELAAMRAGEWVHLAGTWDGIAMRLFVDGVEAAAGAGDAEPSRGDLLVGGDDSGPELLAFPGVLDEARLHARELDAEEIALLATPP
jgi:beta-galactosidase